MPVPKKRSEFSQRMVASGAMIRKNQNESLWKGPEIDGITQSMMSRWLCCRERFRIENIEGLKVKDRFSSRLEFGNMWHKCEEVLSAGGDWKKALKDYCMSLSKKYRNDTGQVDKWYNVILVQFPIYLDFWKKHPDTISGKSLMQEFAFKVPYELPSGRKVLLRGKWDTVDILKENKTSGIYVQDHKTKGDINQELLFKQLQFDLQTMTYVVAAQEHFSKDKSTKNIPILGIRYNVIRRPLSGGRGSIKQLEGSKNRKPETKKEYFTRLQQYFIEEPEYWFMKWKIEISQKDIEAFKIQTLNPVLENILDDFEWWNFCKKDSIDVWDLQKRIQNFPHHKNHHFRLPFGVYNPISEGGASDLDEYLATGSEVGLERSKKLFVELA